MSKVVGIGATQRPNGDWAIALPKGKIVDLTEEEAWALGRDLWAKRVHLDPRLRASTNGPSVLEVLERQLDAVIEMFAQSPNQTELYYSAYGIAWAVGAMRDPYEDRRESAQEQMRRAYERRWTESCGRCGATFSNDDAYYRHVASCKGNVVL